MVPSMVAVKEDEDEDILRGNQGPGMDFDLQETNDDDDEAELVTVTDGSRPLARDPTGASGSRSSDGRSRLLYDTPPCC